MISIVVLIVFICYAGLVAILAIGWRLASTKPMEGSVSAALEGGPLISVLVAARNEERCLPILLKDLGAQHYPNYEVIIVDDQSEDNTADVCRRVVADDPRFRLVSANGEGKKAALTQAVAAAQGLWIVTTDADCRVGPNWLAAMTQMFVNETVMLCFGPVGTFGSTRFDCMQSMEFAALIGSGAATAAFGKPTMCNGANLAYRKAAFVAVNGYSGNEKIPSGDDEFLMRKIYNQFPESVRYCADANALVTTGTSPTINAFFEQRVRWAGKWRYNTSMTANLLALGMLLFHLCMLALPVLLVTGTIKPSVALLCILIKVVAELYFLYSLRSLMVLRWSWTAFLILQLVHSCYVVVVAIWSQFSDFQWKGRRLKSLMTSGQ
ncbi:MAG TPA: glycosyltransferase [Chryseolinea sp.]|nr:glycosyltransferase [Chryseolinea sp.]